MGGRRWRRRAGWGWGCRSLQPYLPTGEETPDASSAARGGAPETLHVLCLGAHSDDIEIGCGGAVLALAGQARNVEVTWVVFSSDGPREEEARASADAFLANVTKRTVVVKHFRDGFFPYMGGAIKEEFEELKQSCSPDLIFTHYRDDLHQDHRLISELTWNTFRDHLIVEYEIPKYDGDLGSPNVFVPLDRSVCEWKIDYVLKFFRSQADKHWFCRESFMAMLRLRGMEGNVASGYAEGFYCRKAVLGMEAT